ncbi:MAG: hypothetical protein KAG53_09470 [Endozoicomonadaceae bacterium]|nr:hypothetical protein [Endozoicomonadaceae bacterium]
MAPPLVQSLGKPQEDHTTLVDNQDQWSDTLWFIYNERLKNTRKPVDELKQQHKKVNCWSWQWFPSEFSRRSSTLRQACAFKSEYDLMTYYRSSILMNDFLELAHEAVKYPMGNSIDETMLEKSLLLCRYAAEKSKDTHVVDYINYLLKQQMTKKDRHRCMLDSEKTVTNWLKNFRAADPEFD